MLVLTRKVGETIIIGEDIRIVVVAVQGERVRLGIEASPDIIVDREEIHASRTAKRPAVPVPLFVLDGTTNGVMGSPAG